MIYVEYSVLPKTMVYCIHIIMTEPEGCYGNVMMVGWLDVWMHGH